MTSAIEEVYLALASMEIGGVRSRNLGQVKLEIRQADYPLRILLPSTRGEMSFVMIGQIQKITWKIRDLCLWAPVTAGEVAQHAGPMLDYVKGYLAALKELRAPTGQSYTLGFSAQMGPVLWADVDAWAVDCNVTVEEYI